MATERGSYRFTVKETDRGTFFLAAEPAADTLKGLNGLFRIHENVSRSKISDRCDICFGLPATRKSTCCGCIQLPVPGECLPPRSQNLPFAPSPPRFCIRARLR